MLTDVPVIVFLATADAGKAREFYADRLGLTLVDESDFALQFEARGVEIRIQKVASVNPQPFTVLGWDVPSIADAVSDLTNRGVVFKEFSGLEQSDQGIWLSPSGAKVAWFADPDGNMLSLTER